MKRTYSINKKIIALLVSATMLTCFGCGTKSTEKTGDVNDNQIVLEEPVGVAAGYDYVTVRNLYQYEVYNSSVNPSVVEYSFDEDQTFDRYGAIIGASVEPGDALVYSKTKDLDKKIKEKQEEITDFEEDHIAEMDALNKDIYDAKQREYEASKSVMDMLAWEPDEENQKDFYDMWASLYMMPDGIYKRAIQNRLILEENRRQCEELFNLDRDYKVSSLERLQNKVNDATISSNVYGDVVACIYNEDGDYIAKDTPIVAVGDTSTRILKTDYISKGNIAKALDIYALIDGERYELEYENMEPEEYTRLSEQGESTATTFKLVDPENKIELGQYALVVLLKDRRTSVPCVPTDSLKKESDGYYVHLFDGSESKYVPVEIGMKDGKYAEVISGVNVGDMVLSESGAVMGKKTTVLEKDDYSMTQEFNGFAYFPFSEWLVNPIENGDAYVKEILVTDYEEVTEGQTLMTIEAVPDQVEIDRLSRQISRLQTRLEKLQATKYDYDARNITDRGLERSITSNIIRTNRLNRSLSKLKEKSGVIEIKAPYNGIILNAKNIKVGDLLYNSSNLIQIADISRSYIILQDNKNTLNYGNKATVRVVEDTGAVEIEGKVSNVNNICLSKKMNSEYFLITIPEEETANLSGSALGTNGRWDRNTYKVNVTTRSMKNVILVPKAAVINEDKSAYVKVVKEDGSVELVSFIPGGSDNNYYWVADGLEEGMTICWE